MYHISIKSNVIYRLHEQSLRIIYNDKNSTLEELREKANSVIIYKRNLRFFAIEMFQVIKDISPLRGNELLDLNEGVTVI